MNTIDWLSDNSRSSTITHPHANIDWFYMYGALKGRTVSYTSDIVHKRGISFF
jgi:hypothetical protein